MTHGIAASVSTRVYPMELWCAKWRIQRARADTLAEAARCACSCACQRTERHCGVEPQGFLRTESGYFPLLSCSLNTLAPGLFPTAMSWSSWLAPWRAVPAGEQEARLMEAVEAHPEVADGRLPVEVGPQPRRNDARRPHVEERLSCMRKCFGDWHHVVLHFLVFLVILAILGVSTYYLHGQVEEVAIQVHDIKPELKAGLEAIAALKQELQLDELRKLVAAAEKFSQQWGSVSNLSAQVDRNSASVSAIQTALSAVASQTSKLLTVPIVPWISLSAGSWTSIDSRTIVAPNDGFITAIAVYDIRLASATPCNTNLQIMVPTGAPCRYAPAHGMYLTYGVSPVTFDLHTTGTIACTTAVTAAGSYIFTLQAQTMSENRCTIQNGVVVRQWIFSFSTSELNVH